MNLKRINESFKKQYSSVLTEAVDESTKTQLKKALVMRTMQEVANGNGHAKALEVAMQDEIEKFFPDKCWWQVTNCKIFDELFAGVKPREVCDHIVDMLKDDCCDEGAVEDTPSPIEETVSNPDRTISKVDKNLGKEVDRDMVRDLTLIIENDGDVYRRFTTPVINNLKRKKAKGNFDEKLAVQAFVHVVENALRQPYFYRYYSYDIKSVPVAVRYAVAKDLLDGAMDEIEFDDTLTEAPIYDLNTQYDSRKSFYGKAKVDKGDDWNQNKLYSYNTLVAEIVDYEPVVYGIYSATTLRHIKEWLKQLGYRADNAKQIMQDYGQVNESVSSNRGRRLKESTFRGVPGTEFISHGSWNDPEITTTFEGKTYVANYWEVENSMYSYYKEEKEYAETHNDRYAQELRAAYTFDDSDEDFDKFLVDHADSVITDIVEAGRVVENESLKESDDSNGEVTLDKKQPDFHSQYMELTNNGYETVWSGEGKIKLKKTGKSSPKRKEFFNESKKSSGVKLLSEDVKVYRETNLTDFDFWSGALDRVKYLTDDELIQMSDILCELNPDGMTETEINDIFWFEEDWIAEMLGFNSFEEIENRNIEESLTEGRFDDMEPEVWDRDDEEFPDSLTAYDTAHVDIADRIRRKGVIGGYSNIDHMTPIDSDSSRIVADKNRAERIRRKKELLGV
jgi:hypothetical protein